MSFNQSSHLLWPLRFGVLSGVLWLLGAGWALAQSMGSIQVENGWIRATPPNARMSAAYMQLQNHQERDDALIGASSPLAETVEIHNVKEEGGMMKMYPVEGVEVAAKATRELRPGGFHVMLINLKQAPQPGQSFPVTLRFRHAPPLTLELPVRDNLPVQMNPSGHQMQMDSHHR